MIPLYKPHMPEHLPELENILRSGKLSYGEYGKKFERALSGFIGTEQLISVNSFNSAVLVALLALGLKANDEIIASPMACLASNQPLLTMGIKVVWADIDPSRGTLDPESVKSKITPNTKAILHNHFCGYPGYIDEMNEIGREYGIYVIDDAIEAFGSEYKGNLIGNTGTDVTIFSFQYVRFPTTIDGGAIIFKDRQLYEKSLLSRDSGIDRKYFRDDIGEINPLYDITTPGFGATMNEINSYIGCEQMDYVTNILSTQRKNAVRWQSILKEKHPEFSLIRTDHTSNPNYWVFGSLVPEKREAIKEFRGKGYQVSGVHLPNNFYSVFGKKEYLPGIDEFYRKFLAIPSGWWVNL